MILFALIGFHQGDASATIQRFERYMAQAKTFSVAETVSYNGTLVGKGILKVVKPTNMSFVITGTNVDSKFVLNPQGGLELDRLEKLYDTYDAQGRLFVPPTRMSPAISYGIPYLLLDGTFRSVAPPNTKYLFTAKQSVNGTTADLIEANITNQMAKIQVKVWIDSAGHMVRLFRKATTMEGTTTFTYDFSNYVINPSIPADTFSTRIPLGYTPLELERGGYAVEVGKTLPAGNYVSAANGHTVSLKSLIEGKNALVLVVDPEFPSNDDVLKAASQLAGRVPDSKLVVIGTRRDAASAKRIGAASILYDPKGTELAKLDLPGSPTLYLLDKKGAVVQTFFGFDGKFDGVEEALKRLKG